MPPLRSTLSSSANFTFPQNLLTLKNSLRHFLSRSLVQELGRYGPAAQIRSLVWEFFWTEARICWLEVWLTPPAFPLLFFNCSIAAGHFLGLTNIRQAFRLAVH